MTPCSRGSYHNVIAFVFIYVVEQYKEDWAILQMLGCKVLLCTAIVLTVLYLYHTGNWYILSHLAGIWRVLRHSGLSGCLYVCWYICSSIHIFCTSVSISLHPSGTFVHPYIHLYFPWNFWGDICGSVITAICPSIQQLSAYTFGSAGTVLPLHSITLHTVVRYKGHAIA